MNSSNKAANELIHETSPYLLQHAYNPVNWLPWGKEALEKAKSENKAILISIGYSACHWCHVMEHESFEDSLVAKIMNEHFICIKVDREERPDIDQVYMNAVQLMTGRGGWPLNCFATPDGKPFYGGTYFPKDDWQNLLSQLSDLYQNQPEKVLEYAEKLTLGVRSSELIEKQEIAKQFKNEDLKIGIDKWKAQFDTHEGGNNYAPKFPIPNNYEFLLHYASALKDNEVLEHLHLTLKKMAYGGIYDQIAGGFARYSTDMEWKVPHFEKMLYDNAQLVSLYTKAYQAEKNPIYKHIVSETLDFIARDFTDKTGAFYSAYDADSEGEEGKFYVWKKEELKALLGADFELAQHYFNINEKGYWEHENYILLRDKDNGELAQHFNLNEIEFAKRIQKIKNILLTERSKREKPGLDDKSLTSWNALMLKAYAEAYLCFGERKYLEAAEKNAQFILKLQKKSDGGLYHSYKEGISKLNGYLEDYCFTIEAFIALYQATSNVAYLEEASQLMEYSIKHFYDQESGMFFFTSNEDEALIARKTEISDNVIVASNSSMAHSLFRLGLIYDHASHINMSKQMLSNVKNQINTHLSSYSNWALLLLQMANPYYEVAISGKNANEKLHELQQSYFPNCLFLVSKEESTIPLLENKFIQDKTMIYVCENKVCQLPVENPAEAIKQIQF